MLAGSPTAALVGWAWEAENNPAEFKALGLAEHRFNGPAMFPPEISDDELEFYRSQLETTGGGRADWLAYMAAIIGPVSGGGTGGDQAGTASTITRNAETLREWARSNGWVRTEGGGPETWGELNELGEFEWRLKLKFDASTRPGLEPGSARPRFDARLGPEYYVNPFTGDVGGRSVGRHIPLDVEW